MHTGVCHTRLCPGGPLRTLKSRLWCKSGLFRNNPGMGSAKKARFAAGLRSDSPYNVLCDIPLTCECVTHCAGLALA